MYYELEDGYFVHINDIPLEDTLEEEDVPF